MAKICGRYLKKGTFELGGNDAFIVLEEANIEKAVQTAYRSRMRCNAQTGFNAKRFIIQSSIYEQFKQRLIAIIKKKTIIGDPLDPATTLGPMTLMNQLQQLKQQVKVATERDGAKIIYGSLDYQMTKPELKDGNWFAPIVTEGMNTNSESF